MSRVLSTQEAKDAIRNMKSIIDGGLEEQIKQLDNNGKKLSEPNVWDGPLAEKFRNDTWPQTNTALDNAKTQLAELHKSLQDISNNIFTAGGGS